jgi:hypothetical protein
VIIGRMAVCPPPGCTDCTTATFAPGGANGGNSKSGLKEQPDLELKHSGRSMLASDGERVGRRPGGHDLGLNVLFTVAMSP